LGGGPPQKMLSKVRSGSQSLSMCWLPSLKHLDLKADLYTILQVLSLSLFEKLSLKQLLIGEEYKPQELERSIQLNLFDYLTGH